MCVGTTMVEEYVVEETQTQKKEARIRAYKKKRRKKTLPTLPLAYGDCLLNVYFCRSSALFFPPSATNTTADWHVHLSQDQHTHRFTANMYSDTGFFQHTE